MVLPYTNGNVFRTFITGLLALIIGVLSATSLAHIFTYAVRMVQASLIPAGTPSVASIDFAASPLAWLAYELVAKISIIGPAILVIFTLWLMIYNRRQIQKEEQAAR